MAVRVSKSAAKEQIIIEAGFNKRKLVSKPRPYFEQMIVRSTKPPPDGVPPRRKERPKESPKSHKISTIGILRLE